jgi:hypothetical protein
VTGDVDKNLTERIRRINREARERALQRITQRSRQIDELRGEIERLKADLENEHELWIAAHRERDRLKDENRRLRDALSEGLSA